MWCSFRLIVFVFVNLSFGFPNQRFTLFPTSPYYRFSSFVFVHTFPLSFYAVYVSVFVWSIFLCYFFVVSESRAPVTYSFYLLSALPPFIRKPLLVYPVFPDAVFFLAAARRSSAC